MKIWKKIIRLLGLGAWPEANPRNVEMNVHPLRGADLRYGTILGRKCLKCDAFDGAYKG